MTDKLPVAGTPTPGGDGVPSVPETETPYGPLVPYGDVPHGGGEDQRGVDYRRYIAALLRYKWAVIAVTVLGTAAGVGATRVIKPEYVAQATLWIETTGNRDGGGPIRSAQLLEPTAWVDLLRSYVVLDAVVRQMQLYVSYSSMQDSAAMASFGLEERFRPGDYELEVAQDGQAFTLRAGDGTQIQRGTVGDLIGSAVGFKWRPSAQMLRPGATIRFTVVPPRDAALQISRDLSARMDRQGNFLRLELPGKNPTLIAATVNATAERLVEVAAQLKREKLTERRKILDEQLQYAAVNLRGAEISLENFRVRTITLPQDRATAVAPGIELTRGPVFASFFAMQVDRGVARRDRQALERAIESMSDSGVPTDALMVIGAVQQTGLSQALSELAERQVELRALRYSYTDEMPEVQRVLSEVWQMETQTIPRLARSLARELRARESEMTRRIESASRDLEEIPVRAIEEARLRRTVTIAENLYTNLEHRYEETRLAEASSIPDIRILDRAIPPRRPVSDQAIRFMLMAFAGSLGLALLGAVLLDRFDRRLRYPEQVSEDLGLAILGALPHVKAGNGRGRQGLNTVETIEALRGVRLGLLHAYGSAGPLVVTITSPGSGDGKSFLSSNLALAFADAGHRTLLIDGDLRKGELHRPLEASRKPGLADYLSGRVDEREIYQATGYSALDFIGSGTRLPEAPELLGSQAMAGLLVRVRSTYQVILIDSPPLGAGVDPIILGTATGNLLMVLRTGVTDRGLAEAKLDMLQRFPIRILGAVLNDVRPTRQYRYYAYQYYMPSYEAREEQSVKPVTAGEALPDGEA